MVTAKAQYNLSNAKRYFSEHLSVGDYYQEGQKTWGQWFGLGAETLGLAGQVKANDFLALCDNRHPQTSQTLTQRLRQVRKEAEQRWKAPQNCEMLRARKYVENVYYQALARELRGWGYRIRNRPRGDFEE